MLDTTRADEADGGQPTTAAADIAPAAYCFRGDRPPQDNDPEAAFLFRQIGHKSAGVLYGLLWEEPRAVATVQLHWPDRTKPAPKADQIVVRWFACGRGTSWWCRDKRPGLARTAGEPKVSADGRTFTYAVQATTNETATDNLVVAMKDPAASPPPAAATLRALTCQSWRRMTVEIEWGFQAGTEKRDFSGRIEAYNGVVRTVAPLPKDPATRMTARHGWRSPAAPGTRRGIVVELLHLGATQNTRLWQAQGRLADASRTVVTVRTRSGAFSFLPADAETGPILSPEYGFFVRAVDVGAPPAAAPDLLTTKLDAIAGGTAAKGWGSNETPWFGAHPGTKPVRVSTFTLPARSVAMHPSPDRRVAAGWQSPIAGRVNVLAAITDGDPTGGNGVEWSIALDAAGPRQVLAAGALERGASRSVPAGAESDRLTGLAVRPGEMLSLIVGAKDGEHTCDTTIIKFVVTEAGGKGRTWDLTKDVVDSIHAGNPHGDAYGQAGVWHFHTAGKGEAAPVVWASRATSARQFQRELAARGLATVRQRVRARPEQTLAAAMEAIHPQAKGEFPPVPEPPLKAPMRIDVPCPQLMGAWRIGAWHLLRGAKKDAAGRWRFRDPPYSALAHETHLICRALDLMGLHTEARDGLEMWLRRADKPVPKPEGLFADADGCLTGIEWDTQHAGGVGLIQWALAEHYALTGDKARLAQAAGKLRANAEWMLRQRHTFAQDIPGHRRLWCHGLQPPHNIWDFHVWRPWYESNANYYLGIKRYAEVIAELDPQAARHFADEARRYGQDILAAVEKSLVLSPVIRVADGTYRSFIPPAPYIRGPASRCMSANFGSTGHTPGLYPDAIRGGQCLLDGAALLTAEDSRAQGYVDVLEDRLLRENRRLGYRTAGYDPEKHWFSHAGWYYQCGLERTANIHLRWDDVPAFLRTLWNQYAVHVVPGPYTFREHTSRHPVMDKPFEEAAFLERVRCMLVMEQGQRLWLARATPRAWLEPGKRIAVTGAPTHFGPVSYEIASDAGATALTATVELPARRAPKSVLLRLRHPRADVIRSVTVNGRDFPAFDADKEVVELKGLTGKVTVVARYRAGGS